MAFLENLGRSNALSSVNNVMGKAIELRQGEDKSAERAYTMGLQAEELGIHKAAAEREATKFEWAAKKEKEAAALRSMPVPVSQVFGPDYQTDPGKKMQLDKARELGLITEPAPGVLMTTMGNAEELKKHAASNLEWTKQVAETNLVNTNNQLIEVDNALGEETNPKKVEELTAKRTMLSKKLTSLTEAAKRIDLKHQQAKDLEKTKAEGRIEGVQIGADAKVEAARVAADARVEAANARAEASKERAAASGATETKEEKRKVKAFTEVRKEVEKAYGFSQFLPSAQDPKLLQKVARGKEVAEDIIDNYKNYGLKSEPKPGTAAALAKKRVDEEFSKPATAPAAKEKKEQSIWNSLFGGEKK